MGLKRSAGVRAGRLAIIINATITRDDPTCKRLKPTRPPSRRALFSARVRITVGAPPFRRGWESTGDVIVAAKERDGAAAAGAQRRGQTRQDSIAG